MTEGMGTELGEVLAKALRPGIDQAIAEAVANRTREISRQFGQFIICNGYLTLKDTGKWERLEVALCRAYPEAFAAPAVDRKEDV